jgi:ATP-dependent RNA helicase DeaD
MKFQDFNLPEALNKALRDMHFHSPTPIQEKAIPIALSGRDLIGCAQTGTGKTAAFSIPILVQLLNNPGKIALVLAPTRELAQQIEVTWKELTRHMPQFGSACLIGGMPMQKQIRVLLRRPRMIIATPGRLTDHLQRGSLKLSQTSVLVLDEADRMLDMGFEPQLSRILTYLPRERQTLLFSATWQSALDRLASKYLRNPERISIGAVSRAAPTVKQSAKNVVGPKKNETLLDELNQRQGSVLIFARTKSRTDRVAKYLNSYGLEVSRLHGGRSQGQRNAALNAFRTGVSRILVATDIAARGIDVAEIAHVINYDLPQLAEDYIHRIGRTGRAGHSGNALSLITPEERDQWKAITKLLGKTGSQAPSLVQ